MGSVGETLLLKIGEEIKEAIRVSLHEQKLDQTLAFKFGQSSISLSSKVASVVDAEVGTIAKSPQAPILTGVSAAIPHLVAIIKRNFCL